MKKNAISHPSVKQSAERGRYGIVHIESLWAGLKHLAIEQEKVNQSSMAANKYEPFEYV